MSAHPDGEGTDPTRPIPDADPTRPLPDADPTRPIQKPYTPMSPYAPPSASPLQGRGGTAYPPPPPPPVPSGYGGYGAAYALPVQKTNGLAIASLVLSIGSVLCWFTALLGIGFGHVALSQIRRTGERGRGLAIAGLVIGYFFVGLFVLLVVTIMAVF